MPKVDLVTLMQAYHSFKADSSRPTLHRNPRYFFKLVGITEDQMFKFRQTKVLKVRAVSAAKIAMLAVSTSEHQHALMKAIEARYGDQ